MMLSTVVQDYCFSVAVAAPESWVCHQRVQMSCFLLKTRESSGPTSSSSSAGLCASSRSFLRHQASNALHIKQEMPCT